MGGFETHGDRSIKLEACTNQDIDEDETFNEETVVDSSNASEYLSGQLNHHRH